jgi:uncharacterized repeat protein (TIGR04138 family)
MTPDLHLAYLRIRKAYGEGFPPEFFEYLYHFIFRSSLKGKDFQHLTVSEICKTFPKQMQADFGSMAASVLERWGVLDFAQVGQAIFLLAEQACFQLNDQDSLEEYAAAGPIQFE